MLQQTQVSRVIPKYRAFLNAFPTVGRLAAARLADVLRAWSGLGYNRRAKALWECAREIERAGSGVPRDLKRLGELPGIGPYTAAAVASFAFGAHVSAVDTNARRVLGRALLGRGDLTLGAARALADAALPARRSADWNQALMDVGAAYCRPAPKCDRCPLRRACRYTIIEGSIIRKLARRSAKADRSNSSLRALRSAKADRSNSSLRALRSAKADQSKSSLRASRSAKADRTNPSAKADRSKTRFERSRRYYRGRIVRELTRAPSLSLFRLGAKVKGGFRKTDMPWLVEVVRGLRADGLVAFDERRALVRLP